MFDRHGLIFRMMIPLGLMVALVLAVLVLSHRATETVRGADAAVIAAQHRALQLGELRSVSRALQRDALNLVIERDAAQLSTIRGRFDRRLATFDADLTALRHKADTESAAEFADYQQTQRSVLETLATVGRLARSDRTAALRLFRQDVRPKERRASAIADRLIDRIRAHETRLSADAARIAAHQERTLLILSGIFSILATALGLTVIVYTVVRPLQAIRRTMEALAAGDAAQVIPETSRTDAIGTMARAIEVFRDATLERDGLRTLREAERAAADDALRREAAEAAQREALEAQRRTLLGDLADAVEASLSTVNDKLRASATRLNRSADDVARYAAAAGDEAEATGRSARQVQEDLAATSAATNQMAQAAADLHATAIDATDAVRTAASRSRDAASRVAGMSAYADRVEELTELIGTVSRQSQLLALNATIEAARAGEAGRGFGVVAHEMKRLAAQTATAAEHVEAEMGAIRAAADEGRAAIDEIGDAMEQIEQNAELVVRSIREQSAANGEVGRGVAAALSSVGTVGERMGALGHAALGTRDVAGKLLADADVLGNDAAEVDTALRSLVSRLRAA